MSEIHCCSIKVIISHPRLVFLTDGTDCSLTFVAQTLGKVCIQGHSGEFSQRIVSCDSSFLYCVSSYSVSTFTMQVPWLMGLALQVEITL